MDHVFPALGNKEVLKGLIYFLMKNIDIYLSEPI